MSSFPPLSQVAGTQLGIYESLWRQADPTNKGRIDGATGASVLKRSKLKEGILHKIWNLCDPTASGFVDKQGFFVALKLIALAQNGRDVSLASLSQIVPPPELVIFVCIDPFIYLSMCRVQVLRLLPALLGNSQEEAGLSLPQTNKSMTQSFTVLILSMESSVGIL
eukprot:m.24758 g.24758  ORF g.24758 m.24758 type:complete len:166 (+) comp28675_c0_seq2:1049-1546(+)